MKEIDTHTFITLHRGDDVRRLAFMADKFPSVNMSYALVQIQGWQMARSKLPTWATIDGIVYPPHLNMEQCSSEVTAIYKQRILARLLGSFLDQSTLIDLTGGFGVDFSFMSRGFRKSIYVERDPALCAVARHNFELLGLPHAEVICDDGVEWLHRQSKPDTAAPIVIYMDPARRDAHGQKVVALGDCTPDVVALRDELMRKADYVILKLSPMLDWHAAVAAMDTGGNVSEVHIVAVGNECKELLLVLAHGHHDLCVVCSNDADIFAFHPRLTNAGSGNLPTATISVSPTGTLLVPNAAIMKTGCFAELAMRFDVRSIDTNSHLFVSPHIVPNFPGRQFRILAVSALGKRELRQNLHGLRQANISVRNFPLSVAELRKRLKLQDGGSVYIFATTWQGRHVLVITSKTSVSQD